MWRPIHIVGTALAATAGVTAAVVASTPAKPLVTLEQLQTLAPRLPAAKAQLYLAPLNAALREFGVTTPARLVAWFGQTLFEADQYLATEEYADGTAYEGRTSLGNVNPGDGARFKGRGAIQLTGRNNYRDVGAKLGVDLVANPTRAADPDLYFRVGGVYWTSHGLNALADSGTLDDFIKITKAINGGLNGEADREVYRLRAAKLFGGIK